MEDRRLASKTVKKEITYKHFFNVAMTVGIAIAILGSLAIFFVQHTEEIARHNRELNRNMALLVFICADMKSEDQLRTTLYNKEKAKIKTSGRDHWNWGFLTDYYTGHLQEAQKRQDECTKLAKEPR
jgi:hypothetical protein